MFRTGGEGRGGVRRGGTTKDNQGALLSTSGASPFEKEAELWRSPQYWGGKQDSKTYDMGGGLNVWEGLQRRYALITRLGTSILKYLQPRGGKG